MGLLAVVAAAGRKGISRDSVLGILWAESAEESARHTLAQHLYSLRRLAGSEAIVATPELRLGPAVSSDIGDLLDALAAEDDEAVIDLYTGDFLHGFYLQGVCRTSNGGWSRNGRGSGRPCCARTNGSRAGWTSGAGPAHRSASGAASPSSTR